MMKRFLIIMIITSCAGFCLAQDIALKDSGQSEKVVVSSEAENGIVFEQIGQGTSAFESQKLSVQRFSTRKSPIEEPKSEKKSYRPNGYRGFFDVAGGFDINFSKIGCFGFSTSQGYQVCPHFFIGAGVSVVYDGFKVFLPVFGNMRINFIDKRCSPFLDFKGGYSPIGWRGMYLSPSIGVNYQFTPNLGLNLSICYSVQHHPDPDPEIVYSKYYFFSNYYLLNYLGFKLGMEF